MNERLHAPLVSAARTVAVVGRGPQTTCVDALLEQGGYDIVVVDSPSHAYSSIKRVVPELVVVCVEVDDPESCQLLSMLKLDTATARIPLVLVPVPDADRDRDDPDTESALAFLSSLPLSPN